MLHNVGIRALDYCPPIDISFGSYLAAAALRAAKFVNAVVEGSGAASDDEVHYPFSSRYKEKAGAKSSDLEKIMRLYTSTSGRRIPGGR